MLCAGYTASGPGRINSVRQSVHHFGACWQECSPCCGSAGQGHCLCCSRHCVNARPSRIHRIASNNADIIIAWEFFEVKIYADNFCVGHSCGCLGPCVLDQGEDAVVAREMSPFITPHQDTANRRATIFAQTSFPPTFQISFFERKYCFR